MHVICCLIFLLASVAATVYRKKGIQITCNSLVNDLLIAPLYSTESKTAVNGHYIVVFNEDILEAEGKLFFQNYGLHNLDIMSLSLSLFCTLQFLVIMSISLR